MEVHKEHAPSHQARKTRKDAGANMSAADSSGSNGNRSGFEQLNGDGDTYGDVVAALALAMFGAHLPSSKTFAVQLEASRFLAIARLDRLHNAPNRQVLLHLYRQVMATATSNKAVDLTGGTPVPPISSTFSGELHVEERTRLLQWQCPKEASAETRVWHL